MGEEGNAILVNRFYQYNDLLSSNFFYFFASGFFHESVSPYPQSIPIGPFQIFLICEYLREFSKNSKRP
jgi:hypothetical protein